MYSRAARALELTTQAVPLHVTHSLTEPPSLTPRP